MKILLATRNKNKAREVARILSEYRDTLGEIELLTLDDVVIKDDVEENGSTFEENSKIKASVPAALGYIGIADDSGLCVDALGGAPGIYSARYSGLGDQGNIDKLLYELRGVPEKAYRAPCS